MLTLADVPVSVPALADARLAGLQARLHAERARGEIRLSVGERGIRTLREAGSLKIRLPAGDSQSILINTAGGIAGGDVYDIDLAAEAGGRLTVTSQAAERVYRTLGPSASVTTRHRIEAGAALHWLPQETILFDGSGLSRRMEVEMAADATFAALESVVLGRRESGEVMTSLTFRDSWTIRQAGRLIHAERVHLDGALPRGVAALGHAGAFATLLIVSPDAESLLARCLPLVAGCGSASAWNGKLVVRLLGRDGFEIRKCLLTLLPALLAPRDLPKAWLF